MRLKFDTKEDFQEIINEISRLVFERGLNRKVTTNFSFDLYNPEEDQGQLIDCRFEKAIIDGKEKTIMIIPSKMNQE